VSAETGIFYDHVHQSGSPFGGTQTSLEPWGRVSALMYFWGAGLGAYVRVL